MFHKCCIVLSTQPASFSALAYKGRLGENLAKIRKMGYDAVELAVRDPSLLDLASLQGLLDKLQLQVVAIGTGQAYGEEGLSFTHPSPSIREKAVQRIQQHMMLAEALGAMVIIGLIRGRTSKQTTKEKCREWLKEALHQCVPSNPRVKLVIEPINRYETDLINTVDEGLEFIEDLHLPQVGLLLDTFHMNIEEPSIPKSIERVGERLYHFHIADSNRWYPGAGHIDFGAIFQSLERIHYQGHISAEILPLPDPDTAAEKTIDFLRERLFSVR